jgi:hypothetical protein
VWTVHETALFWIKRVISLKREKAPNLCQSPS